MTKASYTNYQS